MGSYLRDLYSFLASLAPATWRVKQAYYGNLFPA